MTLLLILGALWLGLHIGERRTRRKYQNVVVSAIELQHETERLLSLMEYEQAVAAKRSGFYEFHLN
jgi:hypothetical protein